MGGVREAMIVAGGLGTRLQPLTFDVPKPLLPFCGQPFLLGVIRRLAQAGVQRVLLVVGPDTAPFDVLVEPARGHGVTVETVPEPEPLDTAGGVRAALDRVTGTFLVLNGDVLTDVRIADVVAAHQRAEADATLVLTRVDDTSTYGVCVRDGTRIVRFVEKPAPGSLPGQDAINAGMYVLEPHVLEHHDPGRLSFERQVFPGALDRGLHLEGYLWDGVWADLGTPERFRLGHELALSGALEWPALSEIPADDDGIRVAGGARVDPDAELEGPSLILAGTTVAATAVVGPDVVLGEQCVVESGAKVRRSILFDRVHVGAGITVDGLIAGSGAVLEAGASLGPDVVLGASERVRPDETIPAGGRRPPPV